ncbi:MAG: BtpA/SgcQ family protein [Candidatus Kapaibacterium sp.]
MARTNPRQVLPFNDPQPLIGMVHLRPLPGTLYFDDSLDTVIDAALADAYHLQQAGFNGLIVENFGDIPFRKNRVELHTVAAMTAVVQEIRREIELPVGINVLRNDPFAAIAVASATGANFIRVNVLTGVMATDQGLIEGEAAEVFAYMERVAPWVTLYADVHVKHAAPLVPRPITEVAQETTYRGGADGLIVTGTQTGGGVDMEELIAVREAVVVPVLAGSGVTVDNVQSILSTCDGAIVGSSLKVDGIAGNPVDPELAREFVEIGRGG